MAGAAKPIIHGRDHACGGADPIPGICDFISGSGTTTYEACTLARPALVCYWPTDEPSGDLTDIVNGRVLTEVTSSATPPAPTYSNPGPFTDIPADVAVGFSGSEGAGPNVQARFHWLMPTGDRDALFTNRHAFTVEMWLYPTAAAVISQRSIFYVTAGVGSAQIALALNTSGQITAYRNPTVLGGITASLVTLNAWVNVRLAYDGTTFSLWLNGTMVDSAASTSNISGGDVYLGNSPSGTQPFSGYVTDLSLIGAADAGFCDTVTSTGPGSSSAAAGDVLTADGSGGTSWAPPAGLDPSTATSWWFPLVDSDGTCVLEDDGKLIPTLLPLP